MKSEEALEIMEDFITEVFVKLKEASKEEQIEASKMTVYPGRDTEEFISSLSKIAKIVDITMTKKDKEAIYMVSSNKEKYQNEIAGLLSRVLIILYSNPVPEEVN